MNPGGGSQRSLQEHLASLDPVNRAALVQYLQNEQQVRQLRQQQHNWQLQQQHQQQQFMVGQGMFGPPNVGYLPGYQDGSGMFSGMGHQGIVPQMLLSSNGAGVGNVGGTLVGDFPSGNVVGGGSSSFVPAKNSSTESGDGLGFPKEGEAEDEPADFPHVEEGWLKAWLKPLSRVNHEGKIVWKHAVGAERAKGVADLCKFLQVYPHDLHDLRVWSLYKDLTPNEKDAFLEWYEREPVEKRLAMGLVGCGWNHLQMDELLDAHNRKHNANPLDPLVAKRKTAAKHRAVHQRYMLEPKSKPNAVIVAKTVAGTHARYGAMEAFVADNGNYDGEAMDVNRSLWFYMLRNQRYITQVLRRVNRRVVRPGEDVTTMDAPFEGLAFPTNFDPDGGILPCLVFQEDPKTHKMTLKKPDDAGV